MVQCKKIVKTDISVLSYSIRKTVVSRWSKKLVKVIWFGWYWVKGDFMNDIVDLKWHWCELVNITMTSRSVYIPGPPPWGFRISGNPTKIIRVSTKLFSDSLILSVIWILLQNIQCLTSSPANFTKEEFI